MCAHRAALADVVPDDPVDERRLAITRKTIDEAMITYPALATFPLIEDAGWQAINAALVGELTPTEALTRIQQVAEHVLATPNDPGRAAP